MQISTAAPNGLCDELELLTRRLDLPKATILELGCGRARMTRLIAEQAPDSRLIAAEVDEIQHEKNLSSESPIQIEFVLAGAEDIPAEASSIDIVLMFKSLHHVPAELMPVAFQEIHRVLKPGGSLWISEPVFAGKFNEILRLFHDEQQVREQAFLATQNAVTQGLFELAGEIFCSVESHFADFREFEEQIIQVTHTNHQLSSAIHEKVKRLFNQHVRPQGALFHNPVRIDHLRKSV